MNYAELSVAQNQRAKEFSKAQTDAMVAYCNAEHDLRELQAENDKLRELVCVMAYCMHEGTDCDGCKINGGVGRIEALDAFWACNELLDRMRDLGIEVAE